MLPRRSRPRTYGRISGIRSRGYLSANTGQGAWWNWVVGGVAGAFSLIFQAIAVLVFPISYAIFSFFYSMYGAVLYVVRAVGAGVVPRPR